jgi:hypothetical protein
MEVNDIHSHGVFSQDKWKQNVYSVSVTALKIRAGLLTRFCLQQTSYVFYPDLFCLAKQWIMCALSCCWNKISALKTCFCWFARITTKDQDVTQHSIFVNNYIVHNLRFKCDHLHKPSKNILPLQKKYFPWLCKPAIGIYSNLLDHSILPRKTSLSVLLSFFY